MIADQYQQSINVKPTLCYSDKGPPHNRNHFPVLLLAQTNTFARQELDFLMRPCAIDHILVRPVTLVLIFRKNEPPH